MTNARRNYTEAEQIRLLSQVERRCPLCDSSLFYEKKSRTFKDYDLAHIYPLNPSEQEQAELANAERLHDDINHPDNIIPLCKSCHGKFDKPRTLLEYRDLYDHKRQLLKTERQREFAAIYQLESEIAHIVASLHSASFNDTAATSTLTLTAKRTERKFDASLPLTTKRTIKHHVEDYYDYVRDQFRELERTHPTCSTLIFSQVKAFYLKNKRAGHSQAEIFTSVTNWICTKTKTSNRHSAEVITSFFVQNCEVFE